jgi:group II intron reverse transcriptase/maturase
MKINVQDRLESLNKRNTFDIKCKENNGLYKLLYNKSLLKDAYHSIKSKKYNMTPGSDNLTLDEYSNKVIDKTIEDLKEQKYEFFPARRKPIPKKNGKTRPLGITSQRDKIVEKAIFIILEAIYNPTLSTHSHNFYRGGGCNTALREIRESWRGKKWAIEGYIKGLYENIDHHILIRILRRKISDEKFIQIIWKILRAGYIEDGNSKPSKVGTPQDGIVSPILANIYLNELDIFIKEKVDNLNSKALRKRNPEWRDIEGKIYRLRVKLKKGLRDDKKTLKEDLRDLKYFKKLQRLIPSIDHFDANYFKMSYIRYADNWLIGLVSPREIAVALKNECKIFLKEVLKLELSLDKTKITYFPAKKVKFLGYIIQSGARPQFSNSRTAIKRTVGWHVRLFVPTLEIIRTLSEKNFCTKDGRALTKKGWINYSDKVIVEKYNHILRGYTNYYSPADNFSSSMNRVQYILKNSCAHTLAGKHRSRISLQLKKLEVLNLNIEKLIVNNIWTFNPHNIERKLIVMSYTSRTLSDS